MPAFLQKQYGPLKGWQWALVVSAGVLVGLYLRSRSTPAPSGEDSASSVGSDSLPGGHSANGAIGVPFPYAENDVSESDFLLESQAEIFQTTFEAQQDYFSSQLDAALSFFDSQSLAGTRETEPLDIAPTAPVSSGGTVSYSEHTAAPATSTQEVVWRLYPLANPSNTVGYYPTRASAASAATALDGTGTSYGIDRVVR